MKTDRRDCRRLAGLHRAGELTPVAVPSPAQEAVRDLCRTRGDMVEDLTRARNRLSGFLLRHSVVWRGGSTWTQRHERWLAGLHFEDRALASTFAHYLATVRLRDAALDAVEADLLPWCGREPFGAQVPRLAAYRGVTRIGGLCLAAEVFDWRRFPRARPFMSFTGLVPSEHSTGKSQRRGSITRAGNAHIRGQLCEAAWSYQHRPSVGVGIRARQVDVPRPPWPAPGPPRFDSPAASVSWRRTRTCARSWLLLWPGSSPASCGPRWWLRPEHGLPVGHRAIGAARDRVLHDAPEHRRSRSDPRRRYVQTSSLRGLHGRPYSEATTCEWLYCDPDSRTSSWRFSDPLRSGASSSTSRPITTLTRGE